MPTFLSRIGYYVAIVLGLFGAMFLGTALGSDDYGFFVACVAIVGGVTWVILAGEGWWLPMCFAVGIGGYFTLPYKIYPHEFALLMCGVAIVPRIAFRPTGMKKNRGPLPWVFFAAFAYLVAHYFYSLVTYGGDFQANGNITRSYMNALWPFVFGLAFFLYGSTRNIRAGLTLMYIALVIRLSFGLTNYLLDETLFVPLINYSIDPQDLRASGSMLMALSGFYVFSVRSPILRIFHSLIFLGATYGFVCGGSRGLLVGMVFFALFLCFVLRRWLTLAALSVSFAALLVTFNFFPSVLDAMPNRVERGFSIFVMRSDAKRDIHDDVRGSDIYHENLRNEGLRRFVATPTTIAVGTGMKPFEVGSVINIGYFEIDPTSILVQMVADTGGYESALWAVIAVTGSIGFLLYVGLLLPWLWQFFVSLRKEFWRGEQFIIIAWACTAVAMWFAMMNYFGGFPSFEIFLSIMALSIMADRRNSAGNDSLPLTAAIAQALQLPQPERRREDALSAR
jgi:hypothetical protein